MAKFKSLVSRLQIDYARRLHKCQHNNRHEVHRGAIRLKVTEGRTDEHFCRNCAIKMLESDILRLQAILAEFQGSLTQREEAS